MALTSRTTGTSYQSPYTESGTIRDQDYAQGDMILVRDHEHANGGQLEEFAFKGLDESAQVVDVWVLERSDKGFVRNQTRSFKLERVVTPNEQRESKMAAKAAKSAKRASAKTPKEGVCEFSGAATKGGRFLPGKDAALKGALLDGAREGVVDACAELLVRWPAKAVNIEADTIKAAKAKIKGDGEAFVSKRTSARLAKVAKGGDPWEAASGLKA